MNYSGEAAEQVVRMSLNGVELAAKISGKAAERLAVLLFAILRDQKKTRGKTRLTNMLKSGKELTVFAVKDEDLKRFCEGAKKYGVLYCVLKDKKAGDGKTDIMVRAEDASKVNRIFERFKLATVDMNSVRTDIETSREDQKPDEDIPVPERNAAEPERMSEEPATPAQEQPNPTVERTQTENPTSGRTTKSRRSAPSSGTANPSRGAGVPDRSEGSRPSVRREMDAIREEQRKESQKEKKNPNRQKEQSRHTSKRKKHKGAR